MPRFLALGDSYTIGEGVVAAERWPNQLCAMLRTRGIQLEDPIICARTAWTTDELADAITAAPPEGTFELVSLLVGVNDQYRGRPVDAFASEFAPLLRRARTLAGKKAKRVLVLSIPDWGATPFAAERDRALIAREIDAFNASAQRLSEQVGATWIDVTIPARAMATDDKLVATDGLHPSGEMYKRWAELVLPHADRVLKGR